MKVYMVTSGQYSDYGVEGIFSTIEKAQEYINCSLAGKEYSSQYFNDIQEIEVDNMYNFVVRDGYKSFFGEMDIDGNIIDEIRSYQTANPNDVNMYRHSYLIYPDNTLNFEIKTKSEQHAIQIINQKRIELISNNQFVPCTSRMYF